MRAFGKGPFIASALPGWPQPLPGDIDSICFYANRAAGPALRRWRLRDQISLAQLARRAELDLTLLAAIEDGALDRLVAALWPLCAAFDAAPADLLGCGAPDADADPETC